MADRKVSELTALGATPALTDYFFFIDISEAADDAKNKRVTFENLFGLMSAGDGFDITVGAGKTLDASVAGTIYFNDTTALTADGADLNQLAGVTVGGTSAGDIVDLDSVQTLTNKTLTTPTIGDFTNMAHDHSNAANGGDLGNVTSGTITGAADTDAVFVFGRGRVGYDGTNTDEFVIAHYDNFTTTSYALRQQANGATQINAATGLTIAFNVNDTTIASVNGSALNINNAGGGYLNARPDADVEHILGRAKIGYDGTNADVMNIAHFDFMNNTDYAFRQGSSGNTHLNTPTGGTMFFKVNNAAIFDLTASGLVGNAGARITQFDNDTTMAANSATRGVTQAAVVGYVASASSSDIISEGDSSVEVVDAGTGDVQITLDSGLIGSIKAADTRFGYDTDYDMYIGRAKIGQAGASDRAAFSHLDQPNTGLVINSAGSPTLSSAAGQTIYLNYGGSSNVEIGSAGLKLINKTLTDTTGLEVSSSSSISYLKQLNNSGSVYLTADNSGGTPQDLVRAHGDNGVNISWGNHTDKSITLTGFNSGSESQTGNITAVDFNNPVIRRVRVYINSDPTADENEQFRLSFYSADTHGEADLIKEFYFNLTYTEVKVAFSATDTSGDVDTTAGISKYDLIRCLGGTAENVRVTSVVDTDTLNFTALANAHSVDTGVVRVEEITDMFQLYDADSSKEIHVKLEALTALTASTSIEVELEIQ